MKRAAAFIREALKTQSRIEAGVARVDLVLRLPEGEPWAVSFSPGIERFIGHYPAPRCNRARRDAADVQPNLA
jgi:hypothetical protein